jgi:hypothetical protein
VLRQWATAALVLATGCHRSAPPAQPVAKTPTRLVVLPAESDAFAKAATALSTALAGASIPGVDAKQVSKVSLEVVQLSIECVDPTTACFAAVGKSLSANRLLFAQLDAQDKHKLKVTVTLFDVDRGATTKTAQKVFASEADASAGAAQLVGEVTQP